MFACILFFLYLVTRSGASNIFVCWLVSFSLCTSHIFNNKTHSFVFLHPLASVSYSLLLSLGGPFFHPVSVVSPLHVAQFASDLVGHPDRQAVTFVLQGLQHGFRLGFQPTRSGLKQPNGTNHLLSRTPKLSTIIWPMRFLDAGWQAPFLQFPSQTYK